MINNEDLVLEATLALAQSQGYAAAYDYLHNALVSWDSLFPAQGYYFLSCLAGGTGNPAAALSWLDEAVTNMGYWYRAEILEDDDLACLFTDTRFQAIKACCQSRYEAAQATACPCFSWQQKTADRLLLAVHGNGQNQHIAKQSWSQLESSGLQVETVQSSTVDSLDRYRWNYDDKNYLEIALAIEGVSGEGYQRCYWGGFSAGCDMLLRVATLTDLSCDGLWLQSPWLPFIERDLEAVCAALAQKPIPLRLWCGTEDVDCKAWTQILYAAALIHGLDVRLHWQDGLRHQFPAILGEDYRVN